MIHLYDEIYLNDAKKNLGVALDYAVNICKINPEDFMSMFISTGCAKYFEDGHPAYISGCSGIELARNIIQQVTNKQLILNYPNETKYSPEYWAGWAIVEYQWKTTKRYKDIFDKVSLQEIIDMYHPYHEMDISNFIEAINEKCNRKIVETKLKKLRVASGYSQADLARISGISKRIIQLYEQKVNDINKAAAITLYKLSRALLCSVEDLLETPILN